MPTNEPTNQKDRDTFNALPPGDQARVKELTRQLYDGTRTVAQCWREALLAVKYGNSEMKL